MTGIGSAVLTELARPMPDKPRWPLRGRSLAASNTKREPSAVDAATYLLTHKDFRKAMTSLSSFHERPGRG